MVVKVSKRKSVNTSGVWEVEAVPESPNQEQKKKVKLDTPSKSENGETKSSSISPSQSKTLNLSPNKGNMQRHFENKSQSIGQSPHIKGNKQHQEHQHKQNQEHQRKQNQERQPKQNQKQQPKQNQKQQHKQNQEQQHKQNQEQQHRQNQEQQHTQEHEQQEQQRPNQSQSNQRQESEDSLNTANLEEEKWTASDLKKLVSRLEEQYKYLFPRPYSEAVEEVDWTKISFDGHSAEECKSKWLTLFEKTRSIRHLVEEAREMLMNKPLIKAFPRPMQLQNSSQQSDTLNSSTAPKDLSGEGDEEEEDVEMKGDDDTSKKIEDKNEEEEGDDDDDEDKEENDEDDDDDDDDEEDDDE